MKFEVEYAANGTPTPLLPGGSWFDSARGGKWYIRAELQTANGEWRVASTEVPAAFCEFDNANGTLKFSRCFIDHKKVQEPAAANAYMKIGGSYKATARNVQLIFQADLKNMAGEWVTAATIIAGGKPVVLDNRNGAFAQKQK